MIFTLGVIILVLLIREMLLAKPKHREELVPIYAYCGSYVYISPFVVPRALIRVVRLFSFKNFGITMGAIRCVIYRKRENDFDVLIGTKASVVGGFYNGSQFDTGVGGAVQYGDSEESTCLEEIDEEIPGIGRLIKKHNVKPTRMIRFTPAQGAFCVVSIYFLDLTVYDSQIKLNEVVQNSDVFSKVKYVDIKDAINREGKYYKKLSTDARLSLEFFNYEKFKL